MGQGMMMDGAWGMGFGLHGVWGLLLWGVIIFGVVALARRFFSRESAGAAEPPARPDERSAAREILAKRFAMGELSREKYEEMEARLSQ